MTFPALLVAVVLGIALVVIWLKWRTTARAEFIRTHPLPLGLMHHTPAVVLSSSKQSNTGLRRCWWYVCLEENIDPRKATRLPLLFALDAKLNIPDGFRYSVNCRGFGEEDRRDRDGGVVHCGGDFSSSSFDGTTDGFGDTSSAVGASGGDGGDSGGGCGGGD